MSLRWNPAPLVRSLRRFVMQTFAERVFINATFTVVVMCAGLVALGFFAALAFLRRLLGLGLLLVLAVSLSGCTAVVGGIVGGTVGGATMGALVARGVASSRAPAALGCKPAPDDWAAADEAAQAEKSRRAAFDKATADALAAEAKRRAAYDAATGREGAVQP